MAGVRAALCAVVITVCAGLAGAEPLPLADVATACGCPTVTSTGPGVWTITADGDLAALVDLPEDAFLCRLAPAANSDTVQLSVGRVRSGRCNALFSPSADRAVDFAGEGLDIAPWRGGWLLRACGKLTVRSHPDYMRKERGLKWYQPLDRSLFRRAPSGWCSWYVYGTGVREVDMLSNLAWLKANLQPYGADVVQLDDGWQGVGHGLGRNRDWTTVCESKFPHGMKWLADQIRADGFVPGLWLVPFGQSNDAVDKANPGVFLRDANGRSVGILDKAWNWPGIPESERMVNWCGSYLVDPTSDRAQEYLKALFRKLCPEWGYDYIKIDGQGGMPGLYNQYRQQLSNPKLAGDEAYRQGLAAMKDVMGPRRFLLNCGGAYDSCGLCNGIRTGGDVGASWAGMQPAIDATFRWLFVNTIAFYTDPDVVCVRPERNAGSSLTLDQARLWATLYGITGQMSLASDNMTTLPDERVELLRRIMPVADVRPMDLYPLSGRPRLFDVRVATPGGGEWDVVAAFCWKASGGEQVTIDPVELGLPAGRYVYYDVWAKQLLGTSDEGLPLTLAPTSCRVVALRPVADHPQLLGTSRHVLQGADDLLFAAWDAANRTWTGRSALVGGDPYELRFSLPPGWNCAGDGVRREGDLAVLTLRSVINTTRPWRLKFQRENVAQAAVPKVEAVQVEPAGRATKVSWSGSDALAYRVYRDGKPVGQVTGTSLTDYPRSRKPVTYEVVALGWAGQSVGTAAQPYVAPPPPKGVAKDAWLDELHPLSATQEYGQLNKGKSVDGNPLRIGGKEYAHGLGTHAHSEIVYLLKNSYQRFEAEVGVDDEKGGAGTVRFLVLADGEVVFDSGVMKGKQPAKHVSVPLDGVEELTLVVTDAGDGINCDHGDWAEARLVGNR